MRITFAKILNFRCLKCVNIPFDRLTVFVGRNGSGKSSILSAINTLFSLNSRITSEDFFNRNTEDPIEINITFGDFTAEERIAFQSHINNNEMVVIKKISWDKEKCVPIEKYFSYAQQIPQFVKIRELEGKREKTEALKKLQTIFPDLITPKSEAEALDIMKQYEEKNPNLLKPLLVQVPFFGARNVGGGKIDNFTRPIFLPAVKEASDEVEGNKSSIYQLLRTVVLQEIENREDLQSFKEELAKRISEKYSPENLGGLEDVSESISDILNRYAPGSKIELVWNEVTQPQISLPTISTTVYEDEYGGEISKKGHGLQRALILSLLEHLSYTLAKAESKTNEKIMNQTEEEKKDHKKIRIDTILLIEEPEIYLHPARTRYLSKILLDLAESGISLEDQSSRVQVIYTTHSPYFVDLERYDKLRICRKLSKDTVPPQTEVVWNDLLSVSNSYEKVCNRYRKKKNLSENFKVRSANVMQTTVNEGFFADLVVLVEGLSDSGVIWKVQEILNQNWDKYSIAIIPADSKENIIRIKILFDGLKIPSYVVFDADSKDYVRTNQRLMRLLGITEQELPKQKVHPQWAYNDKKLEDELIRAISGGTYTEIWKEIAKELGCKYKRICKNITANEVFTEIVYRKGLSLPHYEEIVKQISKLYSTCNALKCPTK